MPKHKEPFTEPVGKVPRVRLNPRRQLYHGEYDRGLDDIARRIAKSGLPRKYIASFLGITQKHLKDWMEQYPSFEHSVIQGEMIRYKKLVAVIEKASPLDWKAAKFLLEIRFADVLQDSKKPVDQLEGKTKSIRITLTERSDSRSITASTGDEIIEDKSIPIQTITHVISEPESKSENSDL